MQREQLELRLVAALGPKRERGQVRRWIVSWKELGYRLTETQPITLGQAQRLIKQLRSRGLCPDARTVLVDR